jgi:hypothetical protein
MALDAIFSQINVVRRRFTQDYLRIDNADLG